MSGVSKAKRTPRHRESSAQQRGETPLDESSILDNGSHNASNLSPNKSARFSRKEEKDQLSRLNDRLAIYIERVRSLETENSRLQVQIRDIEVVEKKEKDNLAGRYEVKIADIRKQLDALTREKAKLEIERAKAVDGYEDLKARATKQEKDLKKAEQEKNNAYNDVQSLNARVNNLDNARNIAERENDKLKKEVEDLTKQLDVLHRQLEDEVVLRTQLENNLATYKEDLEFARRTHNNQMEDFRRKRQVEMTTYSTEVENRYQTKLQEQLQAMRDDFGARIAQSRADVDDTYKKKLAEANEQANRNRIAASDYREESFRQRTRIQELEKALENHEGKVATLNRKISEVEGELRRVRDEYDIRLQQRDERIRALQAEVDATLHEYQDLMDMKIQLDTELLAYQKLLEGEETRLHITPTGSPDVSTREVQSTASHHHVSFSDTVTAPRASEIRRAVKRRRLDQEDTIDFEQIAKSFKSNSHSSIDVVIDDVDVEGAFIRLFNKGDTDVGIGGWFVKSIAGDKEVMFKFHSRQIIKAGKTCTLWSNNSGQEHNPPLNIVMKNQTWPVGEAIRVDLLNDDHESVAYRESILQHGFYRAENGNDPDQRCSIM